MSRSPNLLAGWPAGDGGRPWGPVWASVTEKPPPIIRNTALRARSNAAGVETPRPAPGWRRGAPRGHGPVRSRVAQPLIYPRLKVEIVSYSLVVRFQR